MFKLAKNIVNCNVKAIKEYKGYFTNDIHYKIFNDYVVKKRKYLTKIYIVLTKKQVYTVYVIRIDYNHYYVLGWDKNRIFINRFHSIEIDESTYGILTINENGIYITIIKIDDIEFYRNLGYDYDIIDEFGDVDEVEVDKVGRYRIQGDLVMNVTINDYEYNVLLDVASQLSDIAERIIMNRVLAIVSRHGFNAEQLISTVRINIEDVKKDDYENIKINNRKYNRDEFSELVTSKIMDTIERELYIDDILSKLINANIKTIKERNYKNKLIFKIMDKYRMEYISLLEVIAEMIGINRIEIYCRMRKDYDIIQILKEYKDSIFYNIINNIKNNKQNIELNMGNHHIRIENALPNAFTVMLNNAFNNNNILLNVNIRRIYVTPQTKIIINHPEHGTIYVRFNKPYSIQFTFTDISLIYRDIVNKYMLSKMLKSKTA